MAELSHLLFAQAFIARAPLLGAARLRCSFAGRTGHAVPSRQRRVTSGQFSSRVAGYRLTGQFQVTTRRATDHSPRVAGWCGRTGQQNARVVGGEVVRQGDTVLVADTEAVRERSTEVRYQVLCREHYRAGKLGGQPIGEQLTLG
jgi:hypothetical protein